MVIRQHIAVIGIEIYGSWMIKNGTLGRYNDVALVIGVIVRVPIGAWRPGIIPIKTVIIAIIVTIAIVIIVIQL